MSSLVGIPVELLGLICSDLSTGDILSLCKSCKCLYSAAHPLIFRHITIAWDRSTSPDEPPNFTSLLLFILRHPRYASYIKTIDITRVKYAACFDHSSRLIQKNYPPSLSPDETALLRDVIEELNPPGPGPVVESWCLAMDEEADLGAIIALILALCTHLERLIVDIDFLPPGNDWLTDNYWFTDMIKAVLSVAPERTSRLTRFHKLTHLTVSNLNDPDFDLPTEIFLLCFYLPNITNLCFDNALLDAEAEPWDPTSASYQDLAWPLAHPPLTASLTTLQLSYTSARPTAIEFLLRHTPNLQSLVYNFKLPSSRSLFNLSALRQGLDHVRDTLAHLTVRFVIFALEAVTFAQVVRGSLGPLGDLLPALEDLNVSLGVLLGQVKPQGAPPLADVLPPALKRLTINDDFLDYDAFYAWEGEAIGEFLMAFFAGAWRSATPRLEEFVLDTRKNGFLSYEYWEGKGGEEALRQVVESQGIRCLIRDDIE